MVTPCFCVASGDCECSYCMLVGCIRVIAVKGMLRQFGLSVALRCVLGFASLVLKRCPFVSHDNVES